MSNMYLAHEQSSSTAEAVPLWWNKTLLENARDAFTESRMALATVMSELALCPYRSGMHGRNAPVLPSPDELKYVQGILQRISLCFEHAVG